MDTLSQSPIARADLLALLARFMGKARLGAVADIIGQVPDTPYDLPPKIVSILFASRSGSSYAGRLLANTDHFGRVGENFAPDQLAAIAQRRDLPDLHAATQWMIGHRGTPQAFGYKAGFSVLAAAAYLGFLDQSLGRTQFCLLRRRDRLAQAVSLAKAELSGRFHSNQPGGKPVSFDDYDAALIKKNLKRILRNEKDLADFVAALGKDAPLFYYEDICAEPAAFVRSICGLVDLPMAENFDPEVDLKILRDDISEEWMERFRADHPTNAAIQMH